MLTNADRHDYRYGMHNDKHNEPPLVKRGVFSLLLAALGTFAGGVATVLSTIGLFSGPPQTWTVSMPLQPSDMQALIERWPNDIGIQGGSGTVQVSVVDLAAPLARQFEIAATIANVSFLALILSFTIPAVFHLFGRLRWKALSLAPTLGGAIMVLGTLVSGFLTGVASESFSMQIPGVPVWFGPESLIGLDFGAVLLGILFVLVGLGVRRTGKFAHDADGVV